jgi:hypothetical protein
VPRAALLSTGEECPRGQSLVARRLDVEVHDGDLDWDMLHEFQRAGSQGFYAEAMSAYIRWLAPRYVALREMLPSKLDELRERASLDGQHRRTPENVAQLALGWISFLEFALEVSAIDAA